MSLDLLTGALVFIIVLLIWLLTQRPSGLPPGPPLVPIIGNLLSFDADPRKAFRKLRQQYGDIFCVYMFNNPVIVLNGYNIIKDALVKNGDVFSDRPHSFVSEILLEEKGLSRTSGATWKELRRFTISTLRDLGMGKPVLEDKIREESSFLLKAFENENGEPFDCKQLVYNAVSNIICSTVFGKRHDYWDPLFRKFIKCIQENLTYAGTTSMLNIFPALRHLPGDLFKHKTLARNLDTICESLIIPSIEEHMEHQEETRSDFITAYVKAMKHRKEQGKDTSLDIKNLKYSIVDLFFAGTETTSIVIQWTLVYFLNYPEIQEKCFQEIKENIGLNKPPSMKDKNCLPYMEATIMEVLRHADIAPTSIEHAASENVQFHSYFFPKGVTVIIMLDSVLQDPDVWGDPENFRPERFLDGMGKLKKTDEFVPFSLGRRVCLGESLARMELFLFLVSMIQTFEFLTAGGVKPSMEGILGLTYTPKPFKLRAVRRE